MPRDLGLDPDAWIGRLLDAVQTWSALDREWEVIATHTCSATRCARERELAAARLAEWTA